MATLFNEIFSAIRGRCISDESASVAAEEVAELVVKKFTSTNTGSPKLPLDIVELKQYLNLYEASDYADYDNSVGACSFVEFIERQLRAGA